MMVMCFVTLYDVCFIYKLLKDIHNDLNFILLLFIFVLVWFIYVSQASSSSSHTVFTMKIDIFFLLPVCERPAETTIFNFLSRQHSIINIHFS